MLWARLRYGSADRSLRTLLVVSPMPDEGKTTVAAHLAGAAASVGVRALLVEADVRHPTLAKRIGIEPGQGLSDVLAERASPAEAIQSTESTATNGHRNPGIFGIDLLLAGSVHPNPGELLESQAMRGFLEQATANYDLTVIDSPALTSVADAFPILSLVDGVLIVARRGIHRRDVAEQFCETLSAAGANLVGVVANCFKPPARVRYARGYERPQELFPSAVGQNGTASSRGEPSSPAKV